MEVDVKQLEPVTVLAVSGSVDSLTADQLTEALSAHVKAGRIRQVVDFSGVEYTSSAGLRSLLATVKECRRLGGDMRMAAVQQQVERVLALSGFASIIKIYGDAEAAVSSFGSN